MHIDSLYSTLLINMVRSLQHFTYISSTTTFSMISTEHYIFSILSSVLLFFASLFSSSFRSLLKSSLHIIVYLSFLVILIRLITAPKMKDTYFLKRLPIIIHMPITVLTLLNNVIETLINLEKDMKHASQAKSKHNSHSHHPHAAKQIRRTRKCVVSSTHAHTTDCFSMLVVLFPFTDLTATVSSIFYLLLCVGDTPQCSDYS